MLNHALTPIVFASLAALSFGQKPETRSNEAVLPDSRPASEARYEKIGDLPGVQAVVKYSDRLYRGAQPQNVEGMLELKKLGVTTILSVEEPEQAELDAAKQAGLEVINVPTEYNGIPVDVATAIVTKYRAVDGTVYTHCHHGKHRGGAASAILRMTFEGIPQLEAVQEMAELGASKRYGGLYDSIRRYRPNPALAHRVLEPRPGIDGLIEVTPWILRGTSTMTAEAVASLKALGVRAILSADLSADGQARAKAAGFEVIVVPVAPGESAASELIVKALRERRAEKVFVHATTDATKVAAIIAQFRIHLSLWTPSEAAGEVEALVQGPAGMALAKAIRATP